MLKCLAIADAGACSEFTKIEILEVIVKADVAGFAFETKLSLWRNADLSNRVKKINIPFCHRVLRVLGEMQAGINILQGMLDTAMFANLATLKGDGRAKC